jgi:hypothetical protein
VSLIDDNLIIGSKKAVEKTKKELMERFDCRDCGDFEQYVGCRSPDSWVWTGHPQI